MHPSYQKGHEIGYDLKASRSLIHIDDLVDVIQRSLEVGDHYVLLTIGIYVGYMVAGGIVIFGKNEAVS